MRSLKLAHDLLFENLTIREKLSNNMCPREEEVADFYSELKIGKGLAGCGLEGLHPNGEGGKESFPL